MDSVQVYAFPNPGSGQAGILLGSTYGLARADVGAAFGGQFTNTGYNAVANSLPAGTYLIGVYAHSTVSGSTKLTSVTVNVTGGPTMFLDQPGAGAVLQQPITMSGWALDGAAASGTGVDTIHVWAYPNPGSGAAPVSVGVAHTAEADPMSPQRMAADSTTQDSAPQSEALRQTCISWSRSRAAPQPERSISTNRWW